MSFFLVYDFLILELLGFLAALGYIIFHFSYKVLNTYQDVRSTVARRAAQRKKVQRKIVQAQKAQARGTQEEAKVVKKPERKLTAAEINALEAVIKKVHAKNAVKEFEQARAAIIEGLTIDKHNTELNTLLAQYYERHDDLSKAELIYKDLIVHHEPEDSALYIYLADNLIQQGKIKIAYEIYKQALSRDKENVDVLFALADLAYERLEYEAAMSYAQEITKKQARNIPALEILGQAFMQLEQHQKAYDTFLKIRKLDPYNATVQKWIERLEDKLGIHPDVKRLNKN